MREVAAGALDAGLRTPLTSHCSKGRRGMSGNLSTLAESDMTPLGVAAHVEPWQSSQVASGRLLSCCAASAWGDCCQASVRRNGSYSPLHHPASLGQSRHGCNITVSANRRRRQDSTPGEPGNQEDIGYPPQMVATVSAPDGRSCRRAGQPGHQQRHAKAQHSQGENDGIM